MYRIRDHQEKSRSLETVAPKRGLGLQGLQVGLLNRAVDLLRPGGRIVYSTCSLDPVENEEVICRVLRTRSDVELEDMGDSLRGVETQMG